MKIILDQIKNIFQKTGRLECNENEEFKKLHIKLSKILFDSIDKKDYSTISIILSDYYVNKKLLYNTNGYNILQYSLFLNNNELFYFLLNNLEKEISVYFINQIPELFLISLKNNNYDILEFFLDNFKSNLKKENINECFFESIKLNKQKIIKIIIKNYLHFIDSRNLLASIIYNISNNKNKNLETIFLFPEIVNIINDKDLKNILLLSIMYKNSEALKIVVSNNLLYEKILKIDTELTNKINNFLYSNQNNFLENINDKE